MIGVTLRYKWSTWAMFMVPGLEPVLPSGRLSQKMYTYHLDRVPWLVTKHTGRCVLFKKNTKKIILRIPCLSLAYHTYNWNHWPGRGSLSALPDHRRSPWRTRVPVQNFRIGCRFCCRYRNTRSSVSYTHLTLPTN